MKGTCAGLMALLIAACAPAPESLDTTGFSMTSDVLGGTDVVGFSYSIVAVTCASGVLSTQAPMDFEVDLLDNFLPGQLPNVTFENVGNRSVDGESVHIGADLFVAVEPGCYDIVVQPLAINSAPSEDCATVRNTSEVEVVDGQTTEIYLLSQCLGEPVAALDVAVATNVPPHIEGISVEDDKFVYECTDFTTCVTATDANDDPVEVRFELLSVVIDPYAPPQSGYVVPAAQVSKELVDWTDGRRVWEFCATSDPSIVGDYTWNATVFDLFTNGTRIEDALAADPQYLADGTTLIDSSSSSLNYFSHTFWVKEPRCYFYDVKGDPQFRLAPGVDDGEDTNGDSYDDSLIRTYQCDYLSDNEYYCDPSYHTPAELALTCPNTQDMDITAVYPPCD